MSQATSYAAGVGGALSNDAIRTYYLKHVPLARVGE
jgi:hypothetical protein